MPLPEVQREVYRSNPLAEVVAQFKFAPILRIDAQQPAEFQDGIRERYPTYRVTGTVPPGMPQPMQRMIQELGAAGVLRQHVFGSEDAQWEILLTRESLVVKTKTYQGWQDFEGRLRDVRGSLERAYRP